MMPASRPPALSSGKQLSLPWWSLAHAPCPTVLSTTPTCLSLGALAPAASSTTRSAPHRSQGRGPSRHAKPSRDGKSGRVKPSQVLYASSTQLRSERGEYQTSHSILLLTVAASPAHSTARLTIRVRVSHSTIRARLRVRVGPFDTSLSFVIVSPMRACHRAAAKPRRPRRSRPAGRPPPSRAAAGPRRPAPGGGLRVEG